MRNSVYKYDKAIEIRDTLATLAEHWFRLQEDIKSRKLVDAPKIDNTKLVKGVKLEIYKQKDDRLEVERLGGVNAANNDNY